MEAYIKLSLNYKVNMSIVDDATQDYPAIVKYFDKQGIQIEIDGQHPTGEDCIFDKKMVHG